jgi:anti-sigma regulatory factor (Ser/Thr protein kinase)
MAPEAVDLAQYWPEITVTDHDDARVELRPVPESIGEARRLVRAAIEARGGEVDADVAVLLTSEVVTNALLHARSPMILAVDVRPNMVRIAVHDASSAPPYLRDYSATAGTGRGLHLVQALATEWGLDVGENGNGKWVWFELVERRAAG